MADARVNKFAYALNKLLSRVQAEGGIKYSALSRRDQKLIDFLERSKKVRLTPLPNGDWLIEHE